MSSHSLESCGIKTIYASNFIHVSLWSFVSAQRICGRPVNESIRSFMTFLEIEDLEFFSLQQAYYRKNEEFKKDAAGISKDARDVFHVEPSEVDIVFSIKKGKLF